MSNKKIVITIILLGLIFALIGLLLAMNATGVFDLKKSLSDMPLIGKYFKIEDEVMIIKPLEEENYKLLQEVEQLKILLAQKEKEKNEYEKDIAKYSDQITSLKEKISQLEQKDIKSTQLASYYSRMEDRQAVKIFDNLDDDTVLDILIKLPPEKTAGFLAAMDPMRAAKLTAVLTDKAINAGN